MTEVDANAVTHERERPESVFTMEVDVRPEDIDALGHASNIVYVRWVQDVAVAHSTSVGLDVDAYRTRGAIFVVRRHEIDYLRPVVRGDALLLRTWVHTVMAAKCQRATEIVRSTAAGEQTIARAQTTWGFIELATGRPTRIPDDVRRAFGQPPAGARPRASST